MTNWRLAVDKDVYIRLCLPPKEGEEPVSVFEVSRSGEEILILVNGMSTKDGPTIVEAPTRLARDHFSAMTPRPGCGETAKSERICRDCVGYLRENRGGPGNYGFCETKGLPVSATRLSCKEFELSPLRKTSKTGTEREGICVGCGKRLEYYECEWEWVDEEKGEGRCFDCVVKQRDKAEGERNKLFSAIEDAADVLSRVDNNGVAHRILKDAIVGQVEATQATAMNMATRIGDD